MTILRAALQRTLTLFGASPFTAGEAGHYTRAIEAAAREWERRDLSAALEPAAAMWERYDRETAARASEQQEATR